MPTHRQKDHALHKHISRVTSWRVAMQAIARRRRAGRGRRETNTSLLYTSTSRYYNFVLDYDLRQQLVNRISTTDFAFNFNALMDEQCLLNFRFCKQDIPKVVGAVSWPVEWASTNRNSYRTTPLLSTCIMLRRFASPCRWKDLELLFGKHTPQLSEIFWETVEQFNTARGHLLTADISPQFIQENGERYAEAVLQKSGALDNCVGFIDGTVIGSARPKGNGAQNAVYNGHKKKHALKFQVVMSPDGLILHGNGPKEGRRHDWTLYMQSDMDRQLEEALVVNDRQLCIYGDSAYNFRVYLEVPLQGTSLSADMSAINTAMSAVRVCVEWIFMEVKLHWTTADFKRKLKIHESPVGLVYRTAMLLANIRNCVYHNTVAQYFDCPHPSLDVCLNHKGEAPSED